MPRVVPSQVVIFIDKVFPTVADPMATGLNNLNRGHAGLLAGLRDLVDEIPAELLTMDGDSYAALVCSLAHIREKLSIWSSDRSSRHDLDFIPGFPGQNPVALVRQALSNCPDESPSPSTSELNFISDPDLKTNLRNDMGAINRALSNSEWKAATVLAGSAIEALLLWALQRNSAAATTAATALVANQTFQRQPPADLELWVLHQYIEVAAHLGTIAQQTAIETRLAKDFRNLIHPGRSQRLAQKCDRGTALSAVAGLEHVVRDLTP